PELQVITPGGDAVGGLLNLQYEASRRLLSELRRDYRYVIVEVQSVGEDSTAFALAEFADAALMAVETMLTTRPGAADCLQRLDRLRTSVLGAIVLPASTGKPVRPLPEVGSMSRAASASSRTRPEPRPDSERRTGPASNGRGTSSSPWPSSGLPRSEPQPPGPPPAAKGKGSKAPGSASSGAQSAPLPPPLSGDPKTSGSRSSGSRSAPVSSSARPAGDDLIPWPEPPDKISEG